MASMLCVSRPSLYLQASRFDTVRVCIAGASRQLLIQSMHSTAMLRDLHGNAVRERYAQLSGKLKQEDVQGNKIVLAGRELNSTGCAVYQALALVGFSFHRFVI